MRRPVRAVFIDGPEHGATRTFETDPPPTWLTPGDLVMQASYANVDEMADDINAWPIHEYRRTYRTRKGVWIYEYQGQKR